ncbi:MULTISPECIES: hypothetical protein [Moorena]|uniref:Uncharacterized protein n=1 Tax=Moorena bouillonii PNG TaxID=568701 RepID=A0A1U7N623_9CYAN|nr:MULTISPECIES: hypothetical protein [Moorena]OLT61397.1 hypothetical protein BJP37_22685 [Moorena bouillonii PNG]
MPFAFYSNYFVYNPYKNFSLDKIGLSAQNGQRCLDAVAHGGNHGSRSWGRPPRPRCLPKTAQHRFASYLEISELKDTAQQQAEQERQRAEQAEEALEEAQKTLAQERNRMKALRSQLKAKGIDPKDLDLC